MNEFQSDWVDFFFLDNLYLVWEIVAKLYILLFFSYTFYSSVSSKLVMIGTLQVDSASGRKQM